MRRPSVLALVFPPGSRSPVAIFEAAQTANFDIDFASGKAEDTWSRTYKVAASGRFELINVNGKITAESTDGAEVVVEGRRIAKAGSDEGAKELLAKLEIREEVGESTVRVESRPPRLSGFSGHRDRVDHQGAEGHHRRSPHHQRRRAPQRTVTDEIHAKTTNGGVKGENIVPSLIEASAVNGGIEFELGSPLDCTDSIEMETVNGGVELALPSESKATIAARCVNGGVRVENLEIAKEEQHNDFDRRRPLNGTMNGGGAKVDMSTTNGGVRISKVGSKTS